MNGENKSSMSTISKFERTQANFERAIEKMKENLQYLADQGQVSQKFLSMQNLILSSLIRYQDETEVYISQLELDNFQLSRKLIAEYHKLQANKEALEAICFIHGIYDLPCWLAKGRSYLVQMAVEQNRENIMQLPYQFMEMVEKLNEEDKQAIQQVFRKKWDERTEKEMQELMNEIKQLKNNAQT